MTPLPPPASQQSTPRLLAVLRLQLRLGHYSLRTEQAYVSWVRRFVRFHRCRHPRELDEREVLAFLRALVDERHVSASTQAQALATVGNRQTGQLSCLAAFFRDPSIGGGI